KQRLQLAVKYSVLTLLRNILCIFFQSVFTTYCFIDFCLYSEYLCANVYMCLCVFVCLCFVLCLCLCVVCVCWSVVVWFCSGVCGSGVVCVVLEWCVWFCSGVVLLLCT